MLVLVVTLKHPRGEPFSSSPVLEREVTKVTFGVAVVALEFINKKIVKEPVQELFRRNPGKGRVLGDRRGVAFGELYAVGGVHVRLGSANCEAVPK
jgi:hypothetical protein